MRVLLFAVLLAALVGPQCVSGNPPDSDSSSSASLEATSTAGGDEQTTCCCGTCTADNPQVPVNEAHESASAQGDDGNAADDSGQCCCRTCGPNEQPINRALASKLQKPSPATEPEARSDAGKNHQPV